MRPPECALCSTTDSAKMEKGGLVQFRVVSEEDLAHNRRLEQPGYTGHPRGLEWFCGKHIEAALSFQHLSFGEAMKRLKASD